MSIAAATARTLAAMSAGRILLGCSTSALGQAQPGDIETVNPDDYLAPWLSPGVKGDWTFYTDNNINCRIGGKYLTCIASPSDGLPGSKERNLAWATDAKSLLTVGYTG